ncbi:MAG: hypothetical protein AAF483_05450 [Planctomycetota bacterium]
MVTSAQKTNRTKREKGNPALIQNSLGYDFALLGLKAHESRVSVIRKAARATATRVNDEAEGEAEHDEMLSQIAASTYRLLDPRKRHKSAERAQLCIHSEEDLERQKLARTTMLIERPILVRAELVNSAC